MAPKRLRRQATVEVACWRICGSGSCIASSSVRAVQSDGDVSFAQSAVPDAGDTRSITPLMQFA